jgi:FHS family L-fucose permease-like MFS transporter
MGRMIPLVISVFFFWGFVAAGNDILVAVFKSHLQLEQWQSQMILFVFYVAYTVGALMYLLATYWFKKDLISILGYGKSLSLGLLISALGTLMFIPAANHASFPLLLGGLFIVGLGFSLQQTSANPLTISLGNPETGAQRLSMAGGVNNIGTTIGPLVISFAVFGSYMNDFKSGLDISAVKIPYVILGLLFVLFAIIFWLKNKQLPQHSGNKDHALYSDPNPGRIFSKPQVFLGMMAIFLYVGVEASTAGNLAEYLTRVHGIAEQQLAPYISLFWASLMIGRWTAASGAFGFSTRFTHWMRWVFPFSAFGLFLLVNHVAGHAIDLFKGYAAAIVLLILADIISGGKPSRQIKIYSILGITALILGMVAKGPFALFSMISVGLFCSTLWPCIFTLSIRGMGKDTSKVSNALIMMIMGGGMVSILQGGLASEHLLGIRYSFLLGVLCFSYLLFYAVRMKKIQRE